MNFRQKLIFYVHPGTVPTRAAPQRKLFFHIGRNLLKKINVPFNFVFPPQFLVSRDVNLINMDNTPNILIPAFSAFHHPVRSVKAKLFHITNIFDRDATTKLEFMIKTITNKSPVRPKSFTLTQKHVRINERSSHQIAQSRTFLVAAKCLTVYRENTQIIYVPKSPVRTTTLYSQYYEYKTYYNKMIRGTTT
jgi:hypothetical protein